MTITTCINKATNALTRNPPDTDRYHAWTHCHNEFSKFNSSIKPNQAQSDLLCLHLHCYLGNWGMFRNSKLMQHNFLIHKGVIGIIYDSQYNNLWNANNTPWNANATTIANNAQLIMNLVAAIRTYYKDNGISATDTLVSKVILGTICCIPAFDTKVKKTLKGLGISQTINVQSIQGICNIYLNNTNLFNPLNTPMKYVPFAKMIDFCLWQ